METVRLKPAIALRIMRDAIVGSHALMFTSLQPPSERVAMNSELEASLIVTGRRSSSGR